MRGIPFFLRPRCTPVRPEARTLASMIALTVIITLNLYLRSRRGDYASYCFLFDTKDAHRA